VRLLGVSFRHSEHLTVTLFQKQFTGGTDKSLTRRGKKKATATEDFDVHIPYLLSKLEEY